ncbi:hypothetical protein [uncultured Selenomonas sp.]|uniref:hypothetical protein n=1 Tax=uncultured Selenomonas sp. TaxID=159275 RepID=UPI0028E937E7|nr:hypothetical protein [uncultured Selenomonas sp.]
MQSIGGAGLIDRRMRSIYNIGSTDKFSTTILTHLFRPHFGGKSSTEHHSASGFPPRSDEKIYANLRDCFISDSLGNSGRMQMQHDRMAVHTAVERSYEHEQSEAGEF